MRKVGLALVIGVVASIAGCGAKAEEPGYSKADFEKKPVPAAFSAQHSGPTTPPAVPGK